MRHSIIFIFTLFCTFSTMSAQDQIEFWYSTAGIDEFTSTLCQVSISDDFEEVCVDVPAFSQYAISPDSSMIALREIQDGQIHLLNTGNRDLTSLEVCQPSQLFLWDEYYYRSGTLIWSPDARYLAFTGVTTLSCDIEDQANVYIYDTVEESLRNLTNDVPIIRALITPASWSPDSEWLILYGARSIADTGEFDWGSSLISRTGTDFREIAPNRNTCRLIWSPNMIWLTSNTDCFESNGTGSDLIFIPFGSEILSNSTEFTRYIDEVVSPLHFGHRPTTGWTSSYSSPIWINDQVAVAYRTLFAISGGYLTAEEMEVYSSVGVVTIDISTMTEVMITEQLSVNNTTQIENWFISLQEEDYLLFNPLVEKDFVMPSAMIPCVVRDSVRLSTQGNYIVVVHNCSPDGSGAQLFVYNTERLDEPLFDKTFEITQVRPLGFTP